MGDRVTVDFTKYESSFKRIIRAIKQLPSKIKTTFMKSSSKSTSKSSGKTTKPALKAVKSKGAIKLKPTKAAYKPKK